MVIRIFLSTTILDRGVRDRAYVFVNQEIRGILSRMDAIWSMPLSKVYPGDILQILVENQGRIGYGGANIDFKGNLITCLRLCKLAFI